MGNIYRTLSMIFSPLKNGGTARLEDDPASFWGPCGNFSGANSLLNFGEGSCFS